MIGKFKTQVQTLFVDKNSPVFSVEGSLNIILSPSLYWVKKVSLPVKYLREVKPLLPSLFEEVLPAGNYSYSAYKQGEDYFVFAYEDKMILDTLVSKGISASQVKGVYFAQSELFSIDKPVEIDEQNSLYKKDDIVMALPSSWFAERISLEFDASKLSKHSIALKQFSHIVNDKSLFKMSAIVLVFLLLIATEYFITSHKVTELQTKQENVFQKYHLKATMFQNRAMLQELQTHHKEQMKLRKYMAIALKTPLLKNQKLTLIELRAMKLKLAFSGEKKGLENRLFSFFKKEQIKYSAHYKKGTLYMELIL